MFETTANRALGGRAAGLADGATSVQIAKQVGQPAGSCIYFAVDFEAKSSQMATVIEYIRAASEAIPEYTTGVYGSYAVIDAVWKAQACSRYWQTRAWSYGAVHPYIHIYQYDYGPQRLGLMMNGIDMNLNESLGNEGAWSSLKAEEKEPVLRVEDANKIIKILKAVYKIYPNTEVGRLADAKKTMPF
ncbi:hypothetical protein GCM10008018_69020 [Paenibacillus marchantiophytorum]|uniref:Rv2525c-like glycoside hydrolase-like domain-containing protein n=1 Tax=Paenibacillus marchantiophytorum TaxID=1619310 RepID=A0ABQ1FIW9_9BACL|nr:glycoside hydrolase domain-containing protein [Paenibacillus marchantiophytorum]GGA14323.1 hypothetical protein GCM10008018_69020 [Paenibacillus marchantiophytorum]